MTLLEVNGRGYWETTEENLELLLQAKIAYEQALPILKELASSEDPSNFAVEKLDYCETQNASMFFFLHFSYFFHECKKNNIFIIC